MATWPNNYRRQNSPYRNFGNHAFYFYTPKAGARLNLFLSDYIPKRTSVPDGYGILGTIVPPRTAGGMSAYNKSVAEILFSGNILNSGPVSGTGSITFSGDNKNLSLFTSLDGTSTILFTADGNELKLTIVVAGTGTFTLTGDGDALSMIVSLEGLGTITFSEGTTNLKGLLSLSGEWTPFTELSPENLAASVWNSVAADFNASGTMGEKLNAAGTAGDPWTTDLSGYNTADTAGKIVKQIKGNTDLIPATI